MKTERLFPRPYLIVDNTRPVNALFDPNTFFGSVYALALCPPSQAEGEAWDRTMEDFIRKTRDH